MVMFLSACGNRTWVSTPATHPTHGIGLTGKVSVLDTYGKMPLSFEANEGQVQRRVQFLSRGNGYSLFLAPTELQLVLRRPTANALSDKVHSGLTVHYRNEPPYSKHTILHMRLVNANPQSQLIGLDELPGKVNYFTGRDPQKWRRNLSTFAKVKYQNVYPDVDMICHGNQQQLEYDFVVAPGAVPAVITLDFEEANNLEIDSQGDLLVRTADGNVRQRKPTVYQEANGLRQEIAAHYRLKNKTQVGFEIAPYDASKPLIIDPALVYSTFLGGPGENGGTSIAVDSAGNAYVAGFTTSLNFPTANPAQSNYGGGSFGDAFIAKLNPAGSALLYSTYLGGSGDDVGLSVALDSGGNAYVAGTTNSTDFPTVNPLQETYGGGDSDLFLTKLDSTGSTLVYSTYLGGNGPENEDENFIAVDSAGNAYLTGTTVSTDFPTVNPLQPANTGGSDAFVSKLNPAGTALIYSTYLGGGQNDNGESIAIDAVGNVYIAGKTTSTDFPTMNPLQPALAGGNTDIFVTKLNSTGSALIYSTYIGGNGDDGAFGIAVDSEGSVYVTGETQFGICQPSCSFPTVIPVQPAFGGGFSDAIVLKLNATGTALIYSTYLGGSGDEQALGIAVDTTGNPYILGVTSSTDFPTVSPLQQTLSGGPSDPFVTKLNSAGTAFIYSTYLGGSGNELALGIAVDSDGSAYVTGYTFSSDFPTKNPLQPNLQGVPDAFVAKIFPFNTPSGSAVTVLLSNATTVSFTSVSSAGETTVTTSSSGPTPPVGFNLGSPPIYYDISTTATATPPITICITYDPAQFTNPSNVHLFHYENNAWIDVTASNDTATHLICGQVNGLSPFVIVERAIYNFRGFFQPIDNLPTLNGINAGKAIPVKFSLDGFQGLDIFAPGYPTSTHTTCGNTAEDAIEETVSAGSSSLSYNAAADQYTYVWKTDKAWMGTCRTLIVRLRDGTIHRANFKFTK